jgi:molybdenum cofactor cytidylyltransferase
LLEPADIDLLIATFQECRRGSVLVPTYQGRRGNPVVIDYGHREAILSSGRKLGCRWFIDENPDLVETIEMDNDHVVFDIDTPEDYGRLVERTRETPADAGPRCP